MKNLADKTKYVLSIALMVSIFVPCGIIVALGDLVSEYIRRQS